MPGLELPFDLTIELTEELSFILNLGASIAAALVGGSIAARLGQPAIVGYLFAGMAIGPFTPGFVGDVERIRVLADVGVVLLLFALGVQFSLRELQAVRRIAIGAGVIQILGVLVIGSGAMVLLGFEPRAALVLGAVLSISSTLVVLKTLIDRAEIDSLHGRAAIGWMIVQDIATIVFIVALPPLAGADAVGPFAAAIVKAGIFLALAYLVGTRLLPWVFETISRIGSSELFLLAVVATALLTAFLSSAVFGLSLALGAFVAGILVSESDLSYQAAAEVIPFRDLFAVLFFVSVGMLVDPAALVADVGVVLLLVAIAVVVKGLLSAGLARIFELPLRSSLLLGGLIAQVGEFSFILAENALELGIFDQSAYNLVLGTAVVSIVLTPAAIRVGQRSAEWVEERRGSAVAAAAAPPEPAALVGVSRGEREFLAAGATDRLRVVVLGVGRTGRIVVRAARARGFRCTAVDRDRRRLEEAARLGAETIYGDAANPEILARLDLDRTRVLVIAVGDQLTARLATERALALNGQLTVASRVRGRHEADRIRSVGARRVADPETEAGFELARHALQRMGVSGPELSAILTGLRRDAYGRES